MINVLPDAHASPPTRNVDQTVTMTHRECHHGPRDKPSVQAAAP
jgi:hypothetical protein